MRDGPIFGRDAELLRVREVLRSRHERSQTLLLTGASGMGKSAVVEAALVGMDTEVLYLRGSPLDGTQPLETGLSNIATFEQSERLRPVRERIAEITAWAFAEQVPSVKVARSIVGAMRSIPRAERACVVIWEDLHLYDPVSFKAAAYLARQNHLYDQAYVMLGRSGYDYSIFEGVPRLEIGPLGPESTAQMLSHWSGMTVPTPVADSLAVGGEGNPQVIRAMWTTLSPGQQNGDRPLPIPLTASPAADAYLADLLQSCGDDQLMGLAAFCIRPDLPTKVASDAVAEDALTELMDRGLVTESKGQLRLTHTSLGWAAWQRLDLSSRRRVAQRCGEAWIGTDDAIAALHRSLQIPLPAGAGEHVGGVLRQPSDGSPAVIREVVAELWCRTTRELCAQDALTWLGSCVDAGHLGAALDAWSSVMRAPRTTAELLDMITWRGILARLTGEPSLGLTPPSELNEMADLAPGRRFMGSTLAARAAIYAGAVHEARRQLDEAHALSRFSDPAGRSWWRLVDCECTWAAEGNVSRESYVEVLVRWADHALGQQWLDDVDAVVRLTDLGEPRLAAQVLRAAEAAHADVRGLGRLALLGAQLHLDLNQYRINSAVRRAEEMGQHAISPSLHLDWLRADLIRLHAVTEWSGAAFRAVRHQLDPDATSQAAVAGAAGLAALVEGRYVRAANLLRSALRAPVPAPIDPWELMADLVESLVANGDERLVAHALIRMSELPKPANPAATASALRARALIATPFHLVRAFESALAASDAPGPPVYRARTLLAYARRLSEVGAEQQADQRRREAAALFLDQGLLGWAHHAQQLTGGPVGAPDQTVLLGEDLSPTEHELLRLLTQGARNRQIAEALYVSLRTVEKLLTRLYRRFGVASKQDLIALLGSDGRRPE